MSIRALITSAAVEPGTLRLAAWDALRAAELVVPADLDDPTAVAVCAADIAVASSPEPSGADLTKRLTARGRDVIWLAPRGEPAPADLCALVGSEDPPGGALVRMVDVMHRLRQRCPWDAEQTHASLATYLLEETYEALEALDDGDTDALREELGDLLLQVYFHAEIAAEGGGWTIDSVALGLIDKLVRRHPHVFADVKVRHVGDVEANWDRLKAAEKRRDSVLDGVPAALPALAYAEKVATRLQRGSLLGAYEPGEEADDAESRVGSALLEIVLSARDEGIDAERALRRAARDLARRAET